MSKKNTIKGQDEMDQYKFDRKDIALMLGKSPNAIRMMMRKKHCPLEFRYNGKKYVFKRPRDNIAKRLPDQSTHSNDVEKYHNQVQKKYNRGATHEGKGNYPNDAFKQHNEMKILNSINGKFTSEAHKREFDELNKEGLKIAQDTLFKKRQEEMSAQFQKPGKYGGMLTGYKAVQWQDDINWSRERSNSYDTSFKPNGNSYYGGDTPKEEDRETTYIWTERKTKDPGADYKPGKFKYLDEAIKNTKKDG